MERRRHMEKELEKIKRRELRRIMLGILLALAASQSASPAQPSQLLLVHVGLCN
jgi:hypothetical protein